RDMCHVGSLKVVLRFAAYARYREERAVSSSITTPEEHGIHAKGLNEWGRHASISPASLAPADPDAARCDVHRLSDDALHPGRSYHQHDGGNLLRYRCPATAP